MYRFHVYANYTKYLDYLVFFSPLKRSNKSEKQKVLRGMRESADPSSALSAGLISPHFSVTINVSFRSLFHHRLLRLCTPSVRHRVANVRAQHVLSAAARSRRRDGHSLVQQRVCTVLHLYV